MYQNKRPDSPKGRVYSAFESHGKDAALKLGRELNLPDSKLQRWLEKEFTSTRSGKVQAERLRVYHRGQPELAGTVVEHGEQQSVVKWDNGYTYVESNTGLRYVETGAPF
jgi:hypothetical protein